MILVTLGTQDQKFYRLLDCIEKSKIKDEIIVQAGGSSDYVSKKLKFKWNKTTDTAIFCLDGKASDENDYIIKVMF